MGVKRNANLHSARKVKDDEFYTRLVDIENELKHYKLKFDGKVIYCNCDDPEWSNFYKFFKIHFTHLNLKKIISTHYSKDTSTDKAYKKECFISESGVVVEIDTTLEGDGDFRSDECIELLKQCDIVCTNPPFSLFREYVSQLMLYKKKFLIIGSQNAITYKETFELIKTNSIWLGLSHPKQFSTPTNDTQKFGNICWYTNLAHSKRLDELILWREYSKADYATYANYNAIEVGKVSDIPVDYTGQMGVPITFLEKYNPAQFEILGSSLTLGRPMSEIAKKGSYAQGGPRFYIDSGHGTYRRLYDRIVIKRREK